MENMGVGPSDMALNLISTTYHLLTLGKVTDAQTSVCPGEKWSDRAFRVPWRTDCVLRLLQSFSFTPPPAPGLVVGSLLTAVLHPEQAPELRMLCE